MHSYTLISGINLCIIQGLIPGLVPGLIPGLIPAAVTLRLFPPIKDTALLP